jgi:hypothetical protein
MGGALPPFRCGPASPAVSGYQGSVLYRRYFLEVSMDSGVLGLIPAGEAGILEIVSNELLLVLKDVFMERIEQRGR